MIRESDFVCPRSSVDIDKSVKNKFRWQWLEEIDSNGDALSRYIRKLREDGCAWCLFCGEKIVYSSSGKKAFIRHAGRNAHILKRKNHIENQPLPSAFAATRSKETGELRSSSDMPTQRPVTIQDRVAHAEALFCSFLAEHNLPHSTAPHLISLCKELSKDPEALAMLSMERQTATYKLKHGLAALEHKRLVADMKTTPFSINLDESTSKGNKKRVLNVLVCFFSDKLGKSATHLYCSVEMTIVNSSTVFDAVMNQFREDEIPIFNLISVLSDSAAYMRGEHTGFQAKLKEAAPHLLDVDGDVCHHIQNIVKKFSQELDPERHLEKLLDDLYRDFDLSADLRHDLGELCEILNKPPKVPLERASHRWMSLYDACTRFLDLLEPLRLFYFSWLSVDDKTKYSSVTTTMLAAVGKRERAKVYSIMRRLKGKALTQLGKARKARIASKLFHQENRTLLLANTTSAVLPLFKSFITTFEQKEPMIHRLHDEMQSVFKHFVACFIKHEVIHAASGKLHKVSFMDPSSCLPLGSVFCGSKSESILSKMPKDEAKIFRKTLLSAYKTAAQYMQQKLPLQNTLLATLSALDPELHGHSQAFISMMRLYDFFPTICKADQKDT